MSNILYYSNFCNNCKRLLEIVSKDNTFKNKTHFICIDNRSKRDKETYIILNNQKEILMPEFIKNVPTLQLINRGNQILLGEQILEYIKSTNNVLVSDPDAFDLGNINNNGVFSDNYSFLDQSIESMSAKGNGGLRQVRNNALLDFVDNIETPVDDYTPNKIGEISLDKIQQEREGLLKESKM
tara:strand:+ start:109 stop:657 length:549 start_codon:yes stop_codon:yes gene_type:complete